MVASQDSNSSTYQDDPDYDDEAVKGPRMKEAVHLGWLIVNAEVNKVIKAVEKNSLVQKKKYDATWPEDVCAFTGESFGRGPYKLGHFAHIIPHSENFVPGLGLWLRINGLLSSKFIEAEEIKDGIENKIPLINSLGVPMDFHYRGVIFLLTMDEARKVVRKAENCIFKWASMTEESDKAKFKDWKSSLLAEDWEPHMNNVTLSTSGIPTQMKTRVYECTMFVVHTEQKASRDADCTKPVRMLRTQYVGEDMVEETWRCVNHADKKTLPRPVSVAKETTEDDLGGYKPMPEDEPKMLLPIDPIASTLIFWKTMSHLRSAEGWRFSPYLTDLIKVLEWILVLAEVSNPMEMWDLDDKRKRPTEELAFPLLPRPANGNTTQRESHFKLDVFDKIRGDAWTSRRPTGKVRKESPYKAARVEDHSEAPASTLSHCETSTGLKGSEHRFQSFCASKASIISGNYDNEESDSDSEYDDNMCEHSACHRMLDKIENRSKSLLGQEVAWFSEKVWVSNGDLGNALKELRCNPPREQDFEFLRTRNDQLAELIFDCHGDCEALAKEIGLLNEDDLPVIM